MPKTGRSLAPRVPFAEPVAGIGDRDDLEAARVEPGARSAASRGRAATHGAHDGAQKSSNATRPRSDARCIALPPTTTVARRGGGAGAQRRTRHDGVVEMTQREPVAGRRDVERVSDAVEGDLVLEHVEQLGAVEVNEVDRAVAVEVERDELVIAVERAAVAEQHEAHRAGGQRERAAPELGELDVHHAVAVDCRSRTGCGQALARHHLEAAVAARVQRRAHAVVDEHVPARGIAFERPPEVAAERQRRAGRDDRTVAVEQLDRTAGGGDHRRRGRRRRRLATATEHRRHGAGRDHTHVLQE